MVEHTGSELVKVVVGNEQDRALTASVVQSMDAISERLARADEFNAAVVAALTQLGATPPVVNVPAPHIDVNVPAPEVTVEAAQITVEAPQVTVEAAKAPEVTVQPNIVLPASQRTVTFERDPLTREVTKAEVTEV
jgi:phage baseplate assembly protein gpV